MTDLSDVQRVAVVAAMASELRPMVRALGLRPWAAGGASALAGTVRGRDVVAVVTSMGTRAARAATRRLLDAAAVDHVLVVGICGGVDRRLGLGDLVSPERVVDEETGREYRPIPLGGAPVRGALLTTDVLHDDPAEVAALAARGFVAVDMETAAIGAESEARGIPWSVFRAVSDFAGDPQVDRELIGLSYPDGRANPRAIARFLLTHPQRIPKLVRLGAGMQRAVRGSTAAALAALAAG